MIPLALAVAIASGRRGPILTATALAAILLLPEWLVLLGVVGWALRHRPTDDSEVTFLAGAASHLRAGIPLRHALLSAATSCPDLPLDRFRRSLEAGLPLEACATHVDGLPTQGLATAHALRIAARTGGRMVPMFERLSEKAAASLDLGREAATATAAGRASASLLAGGPMLLVLHRLLTTEASGLHGALMGSGTALIVLGGTTSWLMARRALR